MSIEHHIPAMSLDARLDVRVDDAVEFTFTVTNPTTERVELSFRDGQTADVVVRSAGEVVWQWSRDRAFTAAARTETLAPGEEARRTMTWEDPEPGSYTVIGTLEAHGTTASARNTFEV